MGLPQEAIERRIVDGKITEEFLRRQNLQVAKHFENAPTLVWTVEYLDYPSHIDRPEPEPIVLTRSVDKNRDSVSIRVNGRFSQLTRNQQILSVYYMGQLSYEQGSLDSITLDGSLQTQTLFRIIDILQYSRRSNLSQLLNDLVDDHGWHYDRFPLG